MDPQKNASNPAPYPDSQVPLSAQDDEQRPSAQPHDTSQEVTIDFSQGQEAIPPESSQPGGLGNMPSITPERPAPPSSGDAYVAQPIDPSQQRAQFVTQPGNPYAAGAQPPQQPGPGQVPVGTFPEPGAGVARDAFATTPPPQQPAAQPFGSPTPGFDQQQPGAGVPPSVPAPTVKGGDKKTIFILAGVAILLMVAIVALVVL